MAYFIAIVTGIVGWAVLISIYVRLRVALRGIQNDRNYYKSKRDELNEENAKLYDENRDLKFKISELKSTFEKAKKCIGL